LDRGSWSVVGRGLAGYAETINQQDATVSQVYYLTFMCGSTCFGRFLAHHQELTTALTASGFTVGSWRLERCWSWSGRLCGNNQPTRCNSFTSLLLDVYVWLNMFRALPRPSSGAYNCINSLWFYRWIVPVGALLVVVWQVMRKQLTNKMQQFHKFIT